jgi:hypothetical protein
MKIKKFFIAMNDSLEKYGRIIANIFISLIGVALMLFPGVIFTLFLYNLISLFIGHGLVIKWGEFLSLAIFSFVYWYIGVGICKNNGLTETGRKIDQK